MICACVIVMIKSSSEINISSANTTRLKTFFPRLLFRPNPSLDRRVYRPARDDTPFKFPKHRQVRSESL